MWWGFGDQSLWKKTKSAILAVLEDEELGPVAPYVFHSLAFGSEPIGDGVDGDSFVADLKAMKNALAPYGIPITISEDWDRPGTMSNNEFTALGPTGSEIASVIDLVHVHSESSSAPVDSQTTAKHVAVMPYYHVDRFPHASDVWPYFESYIPFLQNNLPNKPILISEVDLLTSVLTCFLC